MKTNFRKDEHKNELNQMEKKQQELTQEEFEEYVIKSGAKGSFMIYRSEKKEDELGIDEI